ncbi:MAG: hypothetical protein K8R36_20125 [Planctomycetales bacterium]|nr:hypothetical protein [Planctomycetales bacterium]
MRLRLVLLVLAVTGALSAGKEAEAQIRFSIGGSGWSMGNTPYGYGGYGYGYNPYYYNPPVVVRQNYYYYDDDVPQQTYTPAAPYTGPGVTVRNPTGSKVKLAYVLDDSREEEIAAGETQKLMEKGSYIVSFDRGGKHGTARYTITEAAGVSEGRWPQARAAQAKRGGRREAERGLGQLTSPF